jgi:hypothetical protein
MRITCIAEDGKVSVTTNENQLRWFAQVDYPLPAVDLASVVDPLFVGAALARLEPHR